MRDLMNKTEMLIHCWVEAWGGPENVVVAYSGGKDSAVLLHIARRLYPTIPGLFSHTGLEYPELVRLVKQTENIHIVRPRRSFAVIVENYGWPVISKQVSRFVSDVRANQAGRNDKTCNLRLTGITSTGRVCKSQMLPQKWRFLIDAPFKISAVCCEHLKKQPLKDFQATHDFAPMTGVMRVESTMRDRLIKKNGCNQYEIKSPISMPLADWTDEDVWRYIRANDVPYPSVYDRGEKRTGCNFCMFGIMYDRDRFKRLHDNCYQQWDMVVNKLGGGAVLDYLGVPRS